MLVPRWILSDNHGALSATVDATSVALGCIAILLRGMCTLHHAAPHSYKSFTNKSIKLQTHTQTHHILPSGFAFFSAISAPTHSQFVDIVVLLYQRVAVPQSLKCCSIIRMHYTLQFYFILIVRLFYAQLLLSTIFFFCSPVLLCVGLLFFPSIVIVMRYTVQSISSDKCALSHFSSLFSPRFFFFIYLCFIHISCRMQFHIHRIIIDVCSIYMRFDAVSAVGARCDW